MYFQLHGIRQQSSENNSPLKKMFYFFHTLIERPKIYTLSLRNYSYIGLLQRNKYAYIDIYMYIYTKTNEKRKSSFNFSFAFALRVSPLLGLFRHSKVCLLTCYVTDLIVITIIMATVIRSAREQLA